MGDVAETMREAREYFIEKAEEAIREQTTVKRIQKIIKETGISVNRLRELAEADKANRVIILDGDLKSLTFNKSDPDDDNIYCPHCGYNLSDGRWDECYDYFRSIFQCPRCGKFVDVAKVEF